MTWPPYRSCKNCSQAQSRSGEDTREAIAYAFREMLNNAIEHGGKLDPTKILEVICVLLKRAIIYWIKDPAKGFDLSSLRNTRSVQQSGWGPTSPTSSVYRVRKGFGAQAAFGILMADQIRGVGLQ